MPPITGWPTVNFNCPAQREGEHAELRCEMGPNGPDGARLRSSASKMCNNTRSSAYNYVRPTAFGNSHTHIRTLTLTHRRTCLLVRWYCEQFLLFCCGVSFIRFPLQTASINDLGALWQERSQCIHMYYYDASRLKTWPHSRSIGAAKEAAEAREECRLGTSENPESAGQYNLNWFIFFVLFSLFVGLCGMRNVVGQVFL